MFLLLPKNCSARLPKPSIFFFLSMPTLPRMRRRARRVENLPPVRRGNQTLYNFMVWSPRDLDDLLIEPDMPKLDVITQLYIS